ncbi:MAG: hypothetical protein IM534_00525 [Chitinophagaceae bacterium]|jgi:hypothetical protein|nr:hypothetical protein [Chitinophagaceae bacterium]MCE2972782.1 transglutaminase-like domain-containing protein [Sediminibacterium sp.]MCA6470353.1 hypothetical protein [Chitinophagaceae bacterium]MCA6474083.1 hypothetical protein [Chitinophagaceae bacterium]MCA6476474.1 hypothetical protein [Chitinophagaceae bacterium]
MQETNELNALLSLIDDPDSEVYESVVGKLMGYGKPIIPNLENLWENQPDEHIQERIQIIIKKLRLIELGRELKKWKAEGCTHLLDGALLAAKYDQPDLNRESFFESVEQLKKNIWLELNNFLTPLEQAKVLKNIIYDFFGLKGSLLPNCEEDEYFIQKVIETKQGNTITNGILYHALCQQLGIKTSLLHLPNTYMVAFYSTGLLYEPKYPPIREAIQFYVEPGTGKPFSQYNADNYFRSFRLEPTANFFTPLTNEYCVLHLLYQTAKFYERKKNDPIKSAEILSLADQLEYYNPSEENNLST